MVRRSPRAFLPLSSEAEHSEQPEPAEEPEHGDDAATEEQLETEAEEIELADKVFSHRDDESVAAEEEKIEEVKEDSKTFDFAPEQAESFAKAAPIGEDLEQDSETGEDGEPEPDELELEAADEGVPPVDEALEDNALPIADSGTVGEAAEPQAQTASVREQSGHYMHRASRRMRRSAGRRWRPSRCSSASSWRRRRERRAVDRVRRR